MIVNPFNVHSYSPLNNFAQSVQAEVGTSPKMENGVAAPRPPCLRHFLGLPRGHTAEIVANCNVFFRECIRPAQRAHGDVMSSPLTDPGQVSQAFDSYFGIVMTAVIK